MGCSSSKDDTDDVCGLQHPGSSRRSALLQRLSRGSRSRSALDDYRRATFAQPVPVDEPRREQPQAASPHPRVVEEASTAAPPNPLFGPPDADLSIASRSESPSTDAPRASDAPLVFTSLQQARRGSNPLVAGNRNSVHLARGADPSAADDCDSSVGSFVVRDALRQSSGSLPASVATLSSSMLSSPMSSPVSRSSQRGRSAAILRRRASSPQ